MIHIDAHTSALFILTSCRLRPVWWLGLLLDFLFSPHWQVPESRLSELGVPLVKARKLVDRLRSIEVPASASPSLSLSCLVACFS